MLSSIRSLAVKTTPTWLVQLSGPMGQPTAIHTLVVLRQGAMFTILARALFLEVDLACRVHEFESRRAMDTGGF